MKFEFKVAQWFQRRRCLKMLTDGQTDTGVTGILLAHLGAFGSGELKTKSEVKVAVT